MRRVVVMGAGGRDFHVFLTVLRDDPSIEVVAFTAAQIPGIDDRSFPPSLAGPRYPEGIPIRPEGELEAIIRANGVDEVVLAYSDLAHETVMHLASRVLAAGPDFRCIGPKASMLRSRRPVVAVCATRTGAGKSQTSRRVAGILTAAGRRVALIRHPMPYGDLEAMRTQRFVTLDDIDATSPTVEEREEYEEPVRAGIVVHAGVDYDAVLRRAEDDADVIVWDGGNNDFPFIAPDLWITVTDALRPGHETAYHPGETNLRRADVVVVNKVAHGDDPGADAATTAAVVAAVHRANPHATVVRTASALTVTGGTAQLRGRRVLVVEDGPTLTHGGMATGAGFALATIAGAVVVDPRPFAIGTCAEAFDRWPHLGPVLPAMGYGPAQLADLAATIAAAPVDVVVAGTPIDLARLIEPPQPVLRVGYELRELDQPTLAELLLPFTASTG